MLKSVTEFIGSEFIASGAAGQEEESLQHFF